MKSTFVIYFRSLFKHFIIKARSIKLPNESKKKTELENICTEWLELNELFRKFVSFVTIDQIYTKNPSVNKIEKYNSSLRKSINFQKVIIYIFFLGYFNYSSLF